MIQEPPIAVVCKPGDSLPYYFNAVQAAGGAPYPVPTGQSERDTIMQLEVARAVLVTGGPDIAPPLYGREKWNETVEVDPERDALDQIALAWLLERPWVPLLGICRGIQSLNVFAGGSLFQDIPSQLPEAVPHSTPKDAPPTRHLVHVEPDSRMGQWAGAASWTTNSYHHQALDQVAEGFRVTARATDGVIEAIECDDASFWVGVQFHPERMVEDSDPAALALFAAFIAAAVEND